LENDFETIKLNKDLINNNEETLFIYSKKEKIVKAKNQRLTGL
jgi:hypothetical protein